MFDENRRWPEDSILVVDQKHRNLGVQKWHEGFQSINDSSEKKLTLIKVRALFNFLITRLKENLMYG